MNLEVKTAEIRGLETGWLEGGNTSGPILLLLHGYPDTPEVWEYQVKHFRDSYHIVAPYTRGAAPSERASDIARYGLESTVLDLMQLLKIVKGGKEKPVICIGHDMGSAQAMALARVFPLVGLVIVNGMSAEQFLWRLWHRPQQNLLSWYWYAMQIPKVPDFLLRRFPAMMLSIAHKRAALPAGKRPKLAQTLPGIANPLNQYRALFRSTPKWFKGQSKRRLETPIMVLAGDSDPFLLPPKKSEWDRFTKNSAIRILEGGHWIQREKPEAVNELVDKFIAGLGN